MKNSRGVTLVELTIYVGLAGIALLAGFSLLKASSSLQTTASTFTALIDARDVILEKMKSKSAFARTLAHPGNATTFACINAKESCAGHGGAFTLVDENGVPVRFAASAGAPNEGLTFRGEPCTNFNASAGTAQCPFSYALEWRPRCSGTCLNPVVELRAVLQYSPGPATEPVPINTASYNLIVIKTDASAKLAETCLSSGGTPGPNDTCIQAFAGAPCATHHFVVGFTSDGQKICKYLRGYRCATGQVLLGVDVNGTAICGPGCTDPIGNSSGSMW